MMMDEDRSDGKMHKGELIDIDQGDVLIWSDLMDTILRTDDFGEVYGKVFDLRHNKGADADDFGKVLVEAVSRGASPNAITALIREGADVNARDVDGMTLLMRATMRGHAEMVEKLLYEGADASATDSLGRTAADLFPNEQSPRKNYALARLYEACAESEGNAADMKRRAEEFIDLCRTGTSRQIIGAVEAAVDIRKMGCRCLSALWEYMERGDIAPDADVINALAEAGAEVSAYYAWSMTPLMLAARHGALEAIAALIDRGADVNEREDPNHTIFPWTAWMYAAAHDRIEAKTLLLQVGAEVSTEDVYSVWGLSCARDAHWALAAMLQNSEAARRIALDYARNPALKNSDVFPRVREACLSGFGQGGSGISGRDFICLCALGTHRDIEAAIRGGADVNEQSRDMPDGRTIDPYRMTPLMVAAVYNGDPGVIRALLVAGADPEARCEREHVVTKEYYDFCQLLHDGFDDYGDWVRDRALERGNDLTPLMLAVKCGAPEEAVSALLESGARVNARDAGGNTPLVHATQNYRSILGHSIFDRRHVERVKDDDPRAARLSAAARTILLLIEAGADVNARINARIWHEHFSDIGPVLLEAIKLRLPAAVVAAMIERGARINPGNRASITPLMLAAQHGEAETVKVLLEGGAKVDAWSKDDLTAVAGVVIAGSAEAVVMGSSAENAEIVSALLKAGAEARTHVYRNRQTLLMHAAECGAPLMVSLLLEAGADVTARDEDGWAALHYAVPKYAEDEGDFDVGTIAALLDGGADAALKDGDGRRAVDLLGDGDCSDDDSVLQRLRSASGTG